jgi:hypothetical protein
VGFELFFDTRDRPSATLLQGGGGVFSPSFFFPSYGVGQESLFLLAPALPAAARVALAFRSLALHRLDAVYVYDGDSLAAPLLGVFSGTALPPLLRSSGPRMLVLVREGASPRFACF